MEIPDELFRIKMISEVKKETMAELTYHLVCSIASRSWDRPAFLEMHDFHIERMVAEAREQCVALVQTGIIDEEGLELIIDAIKGFRAERHPSEERK